MEVLPEEEKHMPFGSKFSMHCTMDAEAEGGK
jgi:hypothetical protein